MPIRKELGNALWLYLHSLARISEKTNQELLFSEVLTGVANLLPCPKCRKHYFAHTKKKEYQDLIKPTDKVNFLHNQVNLLFKQKVYTLEESIKEFHHISEEEIKITFYKIILTFATFWEKDWTKKVNFHLTNHLQKIINNTFTILKLNNHRNLNLEISDIYSRDHIHSILEQSGMNLIPKNFSYKTHGCNCLNK